MAGGDSLEYLCKLAKAHGARVVVVADGDKRRQHEQQKLWEKHPDVAFVYLPGESEFEEIVPAARYFAALAEVSKIELGDDVAAKIESWVRAVPYRARLAFSKRVGRWFEETHGIEFPPKKQVMERAIALSSPEEIKAEPLRELLARIEELLSKTSFS